MMRRVLVAIGIGVSALGLFFTLVTVAIVVIGLLNFTIPDIWVVENRTTQPLQIFPMAEGGGRPTILRHFNDWLDVFFAGDSEAIFLGPGENVSIIIDGYTWSDIGGGASLAVITSPANGCWICKPDARSRVRFVINDLATLTKASDSVIAAVNEPKRRPFLPIWLIYLLGVGAPIGLYVLRKG